MKSTGIVRKIDRLGRVVIPKEIRKTLRIRVGDPLEIFTDRDGQIIFKKYSPIAELSNIAEEYALALSESLDCGVVICDKDTILACDGVRGKEYMNNYVSKAMVDKLIGTSAVRFNGADVVEIIDRDDMSKVKSQVICPVCMESDPIGGVILISREKEFTDTDLAVAKTLAVLIEKQMEC